MKDMRGGRVSAERIRETRRKCHSNSQGESVAELFMKREKKVDVDGSGQSQLCSM